jgi:hypothetical protein
MGGTTRLDLVNIISIIILSFRNFMSRTQRIKVVDPKNKEIWAPCAKCGKQTAHEALTEVYLNDASPEDDIQWWSHHYTIKCCGCKTVSFCEE